MNAEGKASVAYEQAIRSRGNKPMGARSSSYIGFPNELVS
jgi:hypothetical protein